MYKNFNRFLSHAMQLICKYTLSKVYYTSVKAAEVTKIQK